MRQYYSQLLILIVMHQILVVFILKVLKNNQWNRICRKIYTTSFNYITKITVSLWDYVWHVLYSL